MRAVTASLMFGWYGLVEWLSNSFGQPVRMPPRPRWAQFVSYAGITVFYAQLFLQGGPVWRGVGNEIGIALAALALGLRFATRRGVQGVRYPHVVPQLLFYAAVPLAVGTPRGWLGLTLPFVIVTVNQTRVADAQLATAGDVGARERLAGTDRWIRGVW